MELMFGIGLSLSITAVTLGMWRVANDRSNATQSVSDLGRVRAEIGRIYNTTEQAGYGALTAAALRNRGAELSDLWVPAQSAYNIGGTLITVGAGDRVPGGAGAAGDSYKLVLQSAKPRACQQVVLASMRDAVFARVTNEGGTPIDIAGLPGSATEAAVQVACNRPPSVRVEIDFNN